MRKMDYANAKKLLLAAAKNHLNAMMVGTHGIGKTYLVQDISDSLKLKMKYWSASTMDPYIDLVGVPHVNETGTLDFAIRDDILDMEFLFFDELNRAPLKVRNSVLELVQFKRINGRVLPNLKMVWAAINPPTEDYQVEELDPALRDRFHIHVELKSSPDVEYYKTVMKADTASKIVQWWGSLGDDDKKKTTPRRLEYIGKCFDMGFHIKDVVCEPISKPALELLEDMLKPKKGDELNTTDFLDPKVIKNNFGDVIESTWKP